MLDLKAQEQLIDERIKALTAKHLHYIRLNLLRRASLVVDFLALGVPTFYFAIRFVAKGTDAQFITEIIWELLAATLLVLTLMKLAFRWEDRLEKHTRLMAENNALAAKAKQLLDFKTRVSRREYEDFVGQATKLEDDDHVALGDVPLKQRQRAYRDAIKEFALTKEDAKCPICNASVYTVYPGSCQTCGNTPAKERSR